LLLLEQPQDLIAPGMVVRGDANKRNASSAGRSRVVYGIADVPEFTTRVQTLYIKEPFWIRLGFVYMFGAE